MDLRIEFSPSERLIKGELGDENWLKLKKITFGKSKIKCLLCGFVPGDGQKLKMHIHPYDPDMISLVDDFEKLGTSLLCDACHTIKHFEHAAKAGVIRLVNSDFTQKDLVLVCRAGNQVLNGYVLGGFGIERKIFPLKKKPLEYLEEIKDSEKNINPKIKLIFTEKFDWNNCR